MTELVTITPIGGRDSNGDPTEDGEPFDVTAIDVAPGNTMLRYGIGGDLDTVDFTVYLPLKRRVGLDTVAPPQRMVIALTGEDGAGEFGITVRGKQCRGRVQEWVSGGRGAVVVLAHSGTGRS